MPVVGEFHSKYWRSRANPVVPPGAPPPWMYPLWRGSLTVASAVWGVPFATLAPVWRQLRWLWRLSRQLWWWRSVAQQAQLETWMDRIQQLDSEQHAVLERAVAVLEGPHWSEARAAVRVCATTPKFHQPEQWVEYGRALKSNMGQAQNVFRHVKAVAALRSLSDGAVGISNPDAHLIVELAYHGFASQGRMH